MEFLHKFMIFFVLLIVSAFATKDRPNETYDILYTKAVRAYSDERWFECKQNIEQAIADYRWYRDTISYCRIKCSKQASSSIYKKELIILRFFETVLGRSDCIRRCKQQKLKGRPESITKIIQKDFETRKPYDYLQFCAYKSDDVQLAAAAVYTYILKHPEDKAAKDNIEFYQKLPGVTTESFKNLESQLHQDHYLKAIKFYNNEEYQETIDSIEKALMLYHQEYDRCISLCEDPYDHESLPEFYNAVADHVVSVLKCRNKCPKNLATLYQKEEANFYVEHYNYLQYSYHRVGNLRKAAEAVATYLLFNPDDDGMLKNKQYYLEQPQISEEDMVPRKKAKLYYQKVKEENRLLLFIKKEYMTAEDAEEAVIQDRKKASSLFGEKGQEYKHGMDMYRDGHGLTLVMDESDLGESDRFLVDGFLKKDQCQQIAKLAQVSTEASEKTGQLTFSRVVQMAKNSTASVKVAKLLVTVAKDSKVYLTHHLNILRSLYFRFAELVCFSADSDKWSHDVKTDNCEVMEDGICVKYDTSQAYSALLFLTSSHTGGKYYFENEEAYMDKDVPGQCGYLLGYKSNSWYGVRPLEKGTVCALKMSFTLEEKYQDLSHKMAEDSLTAMETKKKFLKNPALTEMLNHDKIQLDMVEDDLNGTERFAATEIVSSEECEVLIKLANEGGMSGHGYQESGDTTAPPSPHTQHEKYRGLGVQNAAELAASHKVDISSARLYLDIAEKARKLTQTYFALDQPLYFDYTHLVCRTAVDDQNKDREDLSHPVHSDNCHIQADGSCPRRPPAYAERDYSSLVYLNGNFEGGEFFFADKNLSVQAEVRPKCGMMVAFNAGNYHGVKAVLSGQRCAVALWYTLDPRYNEEAHIIANDILDKVEKPQGPDHGEL